MPEQRRPWEFGAGRHGGPLACVTAADRTPPDGPGRAVLDDRLIPLPATLYGVVVYDLPGLEAREVIAVFPSAKDADEHARTQGLDCYTVVPVSFPDGTTPPAPRVPA